jgi:hypothetical protein
MPAEPRRDDEDDNRHGTVVRPDVWRPRDRHVLLGVSHPSDDPARHRTFEVRATYDAAARGWVAKVGEQNLNEQRGDWAPVEPADAGSRVFPSAAACLGHAVTMIVAEVDQDADEAP